MLYNDANESDIWGMHVDFNSCVDFCIWVLEEDGLQVPPFTHHPEGNRILRQEGLNATDWFYWFEKVVRASDSRLNWHVENLDRSISDSQASFARMRSEVAKINPNLQLRKQNSDREEVAGLNRSLMWQEQQYQEALAFSGGSILNYSDPSELWVNGDQIRQLLSQLWNVYSSQVKDLRTSPLQESFKEIFAAATESEMEAIASSLVESRANRDRELYENLKLIRNRPSTLQIYQVAYPYVLEYALPPVYIIISLERGLAGEDDFNKSVLCMAQQIAGVSD